MKACRAVALMAFLALLGCALPGGWHEVLGTSGAGFPSRSAKILDDVRIEDLRIRHVRLVGAACARGYLEHVELDGRIGPDATDYLDQMLSRASECRRPDGTSYAKVVHMNSSGGSLFYGLRMGEVLRYHKVETLILHGQVCASACAIAFLGGVHRTIIGDGRLLFHAPYIYEDDGIRCAEADQVGELKDYFAAVLGADVGQVVYTKAMELCSEDDGWIIGSAEARRYRVTTR